MMAEGGSELSDSVRDSDCYYDVSCFPCERDGRNVETIKYCVDCKEDLCTTCLTDHNKFASTRLHTFLDQVQASHGQTKQIPSQRCSKHGGKIIDVYCPEDDTVGCSTCISDDHSACKGKQFIPDLAVGIKTSKELKKLETGMRTLRSKLNDLKKREGDNLQRLKHDRDALKKQIQSIRKKMNEQLDKMEKELLQEADKKFQHNIDAIHASIAEVDDMLAKEKQAMDQVKSDNTDADIFVSCKIVKQEMSEEIYPLHGRVEKLFPERSYELNLDEDAKLIMEGKRMFASINEKYTIQNAECMDDINIRTSDDRTVCDVTAICALPDGCLVMSDYNNKKLKKWDPVSNNISTLIDLPDNPFGICLTDNTRLAVCLINQKKIQFVSLSGKITLDNSFSVGDRCRDVAHCDGLLYICCGGSHNQERKEGRGHVEVYNYTGELLRCFYEEFDRPAYITVVKDGYTTTMYTADHYKGVHVRGIDGAVKHQFPTDPKTEFPFCLIGTDQLCMGEGSTKNIYIQTYKDKRILIQKNEMKGLPICLYFDERSSLLFVALLRCDVIQVFNLNIK